MDFREKIILMYFRTVADEFIYSELADVVGVSYEMLNDILEKLLEEQYLFYDEYKLLALSSVGMEYLLSENLEGIDIFELFQESKELQFSMHTLPINGIYIPKKFDEKYK